MLLVGRPKLVKLFSKMNNLSLQIISQKWAFNIMSRYYIIWHEICRTIILGLKGTPQFDGYVHEYSGN